MQKNMLNTGITKFALGASMCAALAACGGGGSGNSGASSAADTTPTVTTSGTAAIGAPIVGGTVSLKCASGATTSATTAADGTYSVTLKSTDYPCVGLVSGGQANGAALASALHSVAAAPGTTNVTPLTDLIVGVLGNGNASALDGATSSALSSAVTADNLASALTKVKTAIATLPGKLAIASGFNPLNSKFGVGDANDALLDQYAAALGAAGLTQADAVTHTQAGTPMTTTPYSAIAYTTPGITAVPMGTSVNLDNTFGIAIADPNRGLYVAQANIDTNGNVTSFTKAGKFTAVVSVLGNRVGELCTANGVGSTVAGQPGQYVYVSSDMVEVTDLSVLNGLVFDEYEDCQQSGTSTFDGSGNVTFTGSDNQTDPAVSVVQAITVAGIADPANHSVEHAKVYKYTDSTTTPATTRYAYITINSTTGTDDPLTFDTDTKYVTIGLSR
ncbi:putative lipoprotein [Burkholderia contaminans]|uniref:hypothetical protein n=1 Tax=Burkholderia contaminans TaxID=488447 RepID=UPI0014544FBA|nr:hypothetical protein [Burkholderia contaminans]VWD42648.1 putative lipoprotein [Burkholderia contaminans]